MDKVEYGCNSKKVQKPENVMKMAVKAAQRAFPVVSLAEEVQGNPIRQGKKW